MTDLVGRLCETPTRLTRRLTETAYNESMNGFFSNVS
jgi:hypothetical protein